MNTKIIVIVGPTASGKTAVAVELAKRLNGEIISADSRTIFQGMDIGTAKPDLIERGGVPHFGFDLVQPNERFTVVDWKNYAKEKISEILARGRQPIVVGGTGLYVDALVFDYQFSEEAKKGELDRKKMGDEYEIYGILTDREELGKRIKKRVQSMFSEDLYEEEKLFGSKTRTKLLSLFFSNIERSYYVREMTRVIDEQINSVRRELSNLESIGVIKNETYDNKVYYSANTKHPFARALNMMFSTRVDKVLVETAVKDSTWDEYIRPVKSYLSFLFVTNRVPGQDGVDMLIVGDDRTKKLSRWAEVVEKKEGKPLNYVIISRDDFRYRLSVKDRFLKEIMEMQHIVQYDPEGMLN